MVSLTTSTQWHPEAEKYIFQGNYTKAADIYEEEIAANPDIKSSYWYLGLILLLQGQEVEAQTTWFMAMMEGEAEEVEAWNQELLTVLQAEAERREKQEEYTIAWKIRQSIREVSPTDVNNILHLIHLSIELESNTGEYINEFGLVELLKSEPKPEIKLELLKLILGGVLEYIYLHQSTFDFVEACLPYFQEHKEELLTTLVPPALKIGYIRKHPGIAAWLCERYLQISPENAEVIAHLTTFYQNSCEYDKAIETAKLYNSLVKELPDIVFAGRQMMRAFMMAGGYWHEFYPVHQKLQESILELVAENNTQIGEAKTVRFFNVNFFTYYIEDNPRKNREVQNKLLNYCQANIENYSGETISKYRQGHIERKPNKSANKKIKIGYICHCFRSHSVGWLSRWLIQFHDRDKFQIYGYFVNTNPKNDLLYEWFLGQFDKAYKGVEAEELAEEIYQDEIDILIDLDSITLDTTCIVISLKPAPIQVTWLGLDASGSPNVDYFIADPYVLPESAQEYYQEKIWRLPQTYIAVEGFEVGVPTLNREELDIPLDGVIYLCTQHGYKLHPDIVKLHFRILKEVPNSYYLIKVSADDKSLHQFLQDLAQEVGIDVSRIRHLPIVPTESVHRANLGVADVVLDTYPYNGATTTLETLWMCLPIVTKVGEQFSARNSYTMMMNAGVTEGIAWTDEEYFEWGVRLGKDEALRQQIAWKLKKSRQTSPLWNGKQFTREMEKAYQQMWQIYLQK
ncbi:MAG TPA: O-linked N-acetylglucosamine transferase, SPINDLY family protein [Nostocaceae cyanobacterium]|nr:O-linked N-acetylglucosamine transferase, SPINDLY family protein [Nostocaceae cyanobacterium]